MKTFKVCLCRRTKNSIICLKTLPQYVRAHAFKLTDVEVEPQQVAKQQQTDEKDQDGDKGHNQDSNGARLHCDQRQEH